MVRIEIDNVEVEIEQGSMIIEAADMLEVPIPRFCYHKKLSIAANCRMCLVEVEKAPKPVPACATPVTEGMRIWTKSEKAVDAQRSVMEFLLINHPLDCPICDQGGECELQDVSLGYGRDISRFTEEKRVVPDKNLGPLIATDMTRCIHCTRCVRFGEEISGYRELGAVNRGEHTRITTFIEQNVESEVSGNVIDLCPVGALTSKPYRFTARAWELTSFPSTSMHDCLGSNMFLHVRRNEIKRCVPKENEEINEVWLSDRDRFSYQGLMHEDRLRSPIIRHQGKMVSISWVDALNKVAREIKSSISKYSHEQIGVLVSPNSSCEEAYLIQKMFHDIGCHNIDSRLRMQDFTDQENSPVFQNLGFKYDELINFDNVLLIDSNIHKELPLMGVRLRKASLEGVNIFAVNSIKYDYNFECTQVVAGSNTSNSLSQILSAVHSLLEIKEDSAAADFMNLLSKVSPNDSEKLIAKSITQGKTAIVVGLNGLMHKKSSTIIQLGNILANWINGTFGTLSDGSNAAGCQLAGCVPHRGAGGRPLEKPGVTVTQMFRKPLKAFFLFNVEPEFDTLFGEQAEKHLENVELVVAFTPYYSKSLAKYADLILPICPPSETFGTRINIDGTWQSTPGIVKPFAESRPLWKVMRVLGNFLSLSDFEYSSCDEVLSSFRDVIGDSCKLQNYKLSYPSKITNNSNMTLVPNLSLYRVDNIVRRAMALQNTNDAHEVPKVTINRKVASNLELGEDAYVLVKTASGRVRLKVDMDDKVPDDVAWVTFSHPETKILGLPFDNVELVS